MAEIKTGKLTVKNSELLEGNEKVMNTVLDIVSMTQKDFPDVEINISLSKKS